MAGCCWRGGGLLWIPHGWAQSGKPSTTADALPGGVSGSCCALPAGHRPLCLPITPPDCRGAASPGLMSYQDENQGLWQRGLREPVCGRVGPWPPLWPPWGPFLLSPGRRRLMPQQVSPPLCGAGQGCCPCPGALGGDATALLTHLHPGSSPFAASVVRTAPSGEGILCSCAPAVHPLCALASLG